MAHGTESSPGLGPHHPIKQRSRPREQGWADPQFTMFILRFLGLQMAFTVHQGKGEQAYV